MWSVFFVFLSYLDRNFVKSEALSRALDAEKESKEMFFMLNSTFCAKMSILGENYLYQVSDGIEEVRSVVNPAGKLVDCSVIVNQMQVKAFMHVCRLGLKDQRIERNLETHFARMDEAKLSCREFNKRPESTRRMAHAVKQQDEDKDDSLVPQDKTVKRSKRGFTYPGTLWCGAGNMADSYDHLGAFAETDSCCRIHDHCPYVIHAFSSKYGYTNFKWHSICHCDCDNALRECLRKVNDTASRVVGQAFFNVIGVPCFEFTYEEQCAERHWYGLCKKYEKFPVAVLKESVPYDFGGIDVIDVLTLAPPKKKASKNSNEQEKPESTTHSTISGSHTSSPEEPSIRNVVTAAEDFIKVLATVSTSQSSTADPAKGETQTSERKKGKNTGKKKQKNRKRKGKGKGRKRKPKVDTGGKVEEGASVSPSGSKAEVIDESNFISETGENGQSSRNTNRFIDSEYDLGEKQEQSNEVLKDEPVMDREAADVSITSLTTVKKEPVAQDTNALTLYTEVTPLSKSTSTTSVIPHKTKTRRSRKGKRKKSKIIPIHSPTDVVSNFTLTEKSLMTATDKLSNISVLATNSIAAPTAQPEQQKFRSPAERPASTPIVIHKVKRNRSKERAEGEGRKRRRKIGSAAPIVAAAHKNSTADNLKAISSTGAPTIPSIPAAGPLEPQVPHRSEIYGGRASVPTTAINPTFSTVKTKRQKAKERGPRSRSRKGKTTSPLSSNNPPFYNTSENVVPVLPAPESISALNSQTSTFVISRPTEETVTGGVLTTVTSVPSVSAKTIRPIVSEERTQRQQVSAEVAVSISNEPPHMPVTLTRLNVPTMPSKVEKTEQFNLRRSESSSQVSYMTTTTPPPFMSPIQLSIHRAREQFSRKKRRKSALSVRQL